MRSVSIFGATGSIGEQTFGLLMRAGGPQVYRRVALTGARTVARLAEMARALRGWCRACAPCATGGRWRWPTRKVW